MPPKTTKTRRPAMRQQATPRTYASSGEKMLWKILGSIAGLLVVVGTTFNAVLNSYIAKDTENTKYLREDVSGAVTKIASAIETDAETRRRSVELAEQQVQDSKLIIKLMENLNYATEYGTWRGRDPDAAPPRPSMHELDAKKP